MRDPVLDFARVLDLRSAMTTEQIADWNLWAARLESLCYRVVGCSIWDLAAADEAVALRVFLSGGRCKDYLRQVLA